MKNSKPTTAAMLNTSKQVNVKSNVKKNNPNDLLINKRFL